MLTLTTKNVNYNRNMYDTSGDNQAKIEATTDLTKLNCNAPFVNNSNLKSIIIQNNTQKCNHGDYFLGKNKFCKKCGIYIIEVHITN